MAGVKSGAFEDRRHILSPDSRAFQDTQHIVGLSKHWWMDNKNLEKSQTLSDVSTAFTSLTQPSNRGSLADCQTHEAQCDDNKLNLCNPTCKRPGSCAPAFWHFYAFIVLVAWNVSLMYLWDWFFSPLKSLLKCHHVSENFCVLFTPSPVPHILPCCMRSRTPSPAYLSHLFNPSLDWEQCRSSS
jgi:hypothetical protein